jgi:hypothetical protein
MNTARYFAALAACALAAAALPLSASSQVGDARWLPFVGCWRPVDAGAEAGLLCFRPFEQGVEMFHVGDGQLSRAERLVADGTPRPVVAEGCTGFESVRFSADGLRAFTRSEYTCGDEIRAGSGVMAFVDEERWIDVRALEVQGHPVAWVQAYQLAGAETLAAQAISDPAAFDRNLVRATRIRGARAIEVADVEEAVSLVQARAVEVWVAAQEDEFELTGSELVRLADAGVPESVIDVMIAVSYPERFRLAPDGAVAEREPPDVDAGAYRRGFGAYLWDPFYWDPFYWPSGPGFRRYVPFGYYGYGGFYGPYGGYYGYRPITVIVEPARPRGEMVPGLGYTRGLSSTGSSDGGQPRASVGPERAGGSSGDGVGRDSSGGGDRAGSSSGARPTGRTARPRN